MSRVFVLPSRMNKEGRMQIPFEVRKEMGWTSRDTFSVSMSETEDQITITRQVTGQPSQSETEAE